MVADKFEEIEGNHRKKQTAFETSLARLVCWNIIDGFVNSFPNGNRVSYCWQAIGIPLAHNYALSAQMYVTASC
jgi:hypothetical protein